MSSARFARPSTPSKPKPKNRPNSDFVTAASSKIRCERIQSLRLLDGPTGCAPGTVQPPRSVSKDVSATVAPPTVTFVSSTSMPGTVSVPQSVANTIEISTCLPAYLLRSTFHSCQPPELPEAACHSPVVPVGVHEPPPAGSYVW